MIESVAAKGRRVLNAEQVEEVRRLLRRGKASRAIARQTGIARETIAKIRRGRYGPKQPTPAERDEAEARWDRQYDAKYHSVPKHRCPGCGGHIITRRCLKCDLKNGTLATEEA